MNQGNEGFAFSFLVQMLLYCCSASKLHSLSKNTR